MSHFNSTKGKLARLTLSTENAIGILHVVFNLMPAPQAKVLVLSGRLLSVNTEATSASEMGLGASSISSLVVSQVQHS